MLVAVTVAATVGAPAQATISDQAAYINTAGPLAQRVHAEYNIPASVTVGQSILESAWGTSRLSTNDRNYFGYKCVSPSEPGPIAIGCRAHQTEECGSGGCGPVIAYFRVYASMLDSFRDYGRLLTTSQFYAHALPYRENPDRFIREVAVNYATDPNYATKVINLMRTNDLYRFDTGSVVTSLVGGSPAVVYRDSVQFFAGAAGAGSEGALYQKAYVTGEGWRTWENLGGGITGRTSVVEYNNSLQVYARGADGAVLQRAFVPGEGWRAWTSIGGNVASDPVAVSDGTALHIFARAPNGAVYHRAYVPGGWRAWENLGGETTGQPAVVKYGNSIQVYARGLNGAIYQKAYVVGEGWRAWASLGGNLDSGPSIAVSGTTLHIAARAATGATYLLTYTPSTGWRSWENLGGDVTGTPAAIQYGGSLQIYGHAADGAVHQKAYVPGEGWRAWTSIGGAVAGDPVVVADGTALHVFARVANGALYHRAYVPGGWRAWENLGGSIS